MHVVLCHRHHGLHTFIKSIELEKPLSQYARKIPKTDGEYIVREKTLLADLPTTWLPVPPEGILLSVEDTGQTDLKIFKNWAKYFDCYSITLYRR